MKEIEKNYLYTLIIALLTIVLLHSCSADETLPDDPIIGLGGDDWVQDELDLYLYENFTLPYNIEVKYRWDPYEVNFNRNLVPPEKSKVEPVMETVKAIWMDPYEAIGGEDFLKKYQLLKYVLVGSAEYQDNGTIILGTAEGGNKIVLFVVNYFLKSNRTEVIRMMHTIHHEFAHILHQNIPIPQEWRGISAAWYTATWFNTSNQEANTQGLVTAYAKLSEKEDFVETIAYLLVEGQEAFDQIVEDHPDQATTFRTKEQIVIRYYQELGIDFRQLQQFVQQGIDEVTAN